MATAPKDCTCKQCVAACKESPGWFLPGEAERAAKLLNMSFEEFKNKYLVIDYWIDTESENCDHIYGYAPKKIETEKEIDSMKVASFGYAFYRKRCIFLTKDNKCQIHAAKPHECKMASVCGNQYAERKDMSKEWRKPHNKLNPYKEETLHVSQT